MKKIYTAFISSTFKDLKNVREEVSNILLSYGCLPLRMENFPAIDKSQFEYIKTIIDSADFYILIIGEKYGSIDKKTGKSYTEMEYEYALDLKIPIIAIINNKNTENIKLERFKQKVMDERLVITWENEEEITIGLSDSINKTIQTFGKDSGWISNKDYLLLKNQTLNYLNMLNDLKLVYKYTLYEDSRCLNNHEKLRRIWRSEGILIEKIEISSKAFIKNKNIFLDMTKILDFILKEPRYLYKLGKYVHVEKLNIQNNELYLELTNKEYRKFKIDENIIFKKYYNEEFFDVILGEEGFFILIRYLDQTKEMNNLFEELKDNI